MDSSAGIAAMTKGYSNTMRHLKKVHRVSLAALGDIASQQNIDVSHVSGDENVSDIFTKPLPNHTFKKHTVSLGVAMHRSEGLEATVAIRRIAMATFAAQWAVADAPETDQNSFVPYGLIVIGTCSVGVISMCYVVVLIFQRIWKYSNSGAKRRSTKEVSTQTDSFTVCVTAYGECYHWHPQCDALKDSRTTTLKRMCLRCDKFMKAA